MKAINQRTPFNASNAHGRPSVSERQQFEIEQGDVGRTMNHYRGFNYATHKFTHADVGRVIEQYWYFGWTSWIFTLKGPACV